MKCRRCNRPLKREPWASKGIGKICEGKERIDYQKKDNGDSDIIMPYKGGDIFLERLGAPTYNDKGELNIAVHTCSGIKTNVQRTIYRHSPTGFNYGYGGSGPADTALNILLMFTDKETAENNYQDFKWKFLGSNENKLIIKKEEILGFIGAAKKGLHQAIS